VQERTMAEFDRRGPSPPPLSLGRLRKLLIQRSLLAIAAMREVTKMKEEEGNGELDCEGEG